eukprot:TRINITY_DN3298_c0_g1_i8.p1 TRINITY_DN3298_c0_g1~~TRINITY_DN3298_c0_g1_i8.p1  ORF type:complete len:166 (-),score=36.88 TRINITY_DN3298_c0_g1_i8:91-588(-)
MVILLQFNAAPRLAFGIMCRATGLPPAEAARNITALCEARLIIRTSGAGSFTESNEFTINDSYASRRLKIKVPAAADRGAVAADTGATYRRVDEDRKLFLQATIVRLMKTRKRMKHEALVSEVLGQAQGRFRPSISLIKKCIEALIDKEFVRRDEAESDTYVYIT